MSLCLPTPNPSDVSGGKDLKWRLSIFYLKEARGKRGSSPQHRCQQLARQKYPRPGLHIPVTIMKRLLQTSLYEASSQEEREPLILSGARRIGGWRGDRPGCWPGPQLAVCPETPHRWTRQAILDQCQGELGSRAVVGTWDHTAVREGWPARRGPASGRHPV